MTQTETPKQPANEELRIGVFICHCGLNIAGTLDIKELVEYAKTIPDNVTICGLEQNGICWVYCNK